MNLSFQNIIYIRICLKRKQLNRKVNQLQNLKKKEMTDDSKQENSGEVESILIDENYEKELEELLEEITQEQKTDKDEERSHIRHLLSLL